jgi:hypothetical protein
MENKEYYFIDLDGTLKTDRGFGRGNLLTIGDNKYFYILRPFAKEFLSELSKLGDVFLFTLASARYASYFVKEIGAEPYIKGVYSRERMGSLPKVPSYVLVDNDEEIGKGKRFWLEKNNIVLKNKFILAKTFDGSSDDRELLDILDSIKS